MDDVLRVLAALEERGVRYAVFGAMAMAAHGLDRATPDLDLLVAADDDNVARLREALSSLFDDRRLQRSPPTICEGSTP